MPINVSVPINGTSANRIRTVASAATPGQCLRDRVTGAELLGLRDPRQVACVGKCRTNAIAGMADDDVGALWRKRANRTQDMCEQRLPGEVVQHFGQLRTHPCALTRGKHDDLEVHGIGVRSAVPRIIETHLRKGVTPVTPFIRIM